MNILKTITFVVLIIFCIMAKSETIKGSAYINDILIYTEQHVVRLNTDGTFQEINAVYFDSKNVPFANIKSTFTKSLFIPDVVFQDKRFELNEISEFNSYKNQLYLTSKSKKEEKLRQSAVTSNSIYGQGFNNYIIKNLETLSEEKLNKPLVVNFILAKNLKNIDFEINAKKKNDQEIIVTINPKNFLLKAVVSDIVLTYNIKNKRLLSFSGYSNIEDDNENLQKVFIKYEY